eukprot:CCRYP_016781-RA/>CCRYP_016781-RA protein AED:0.03 eAED:0.03 QI:59/0.5/0.33/1/0.5/0.33/3/1674/1013
MMEQQQVQQQHHQSIPISMGNPLQNQTYDIQQQRRPSNSGGTAGHVHDVQNGNHNQVPSQNQQQLQQQPPVSAIYTNNPIKHRQPQQLNHLQMSNIVVAQSLQHQIQQQQHMNHVLATEQPIPCHHAQNSQQQQNQQCNDQFSTTPHIQNMQQQERSTHVPPQNLVPPSMHPPQNNAGQQSQSNSLSPSPVSQPSIINPSAYPIGHQQQQVMLQPVLSYQPQQQMLHSQGMYTQQPVPMLQSPILYTNATLVSSCQTVIAPSSQEITNLEFSTAVVPPPGSPSEVVKRGRFRVTKGGKSLKNAIENESSNESNARNELFENASVNVPVEQNASAGVEFFPPVQADASVKKKGRFVVKTAAAAAATTSNKTAKSTAIAPGDFSANEVTTHSCLSNGTQSTKGNIVVEDGNKTDGFGKVSGAGDENNSMNSAYASMVNEGTANKPADPPIVSTKKKGRFVVKTGGNAAFSLPAAAPQEAASVDGSLSKHNIPSVVSTVTNSFQAADALLNSSSVPNPNIATTSHQSQQTAFASQVANPLTANVSVPISNIHPAQTFGFGALDVNGHFLLVSAPVMAPNPNAPSTQSVPSHSTSNTILSGIGANLGHQPQQSSQRHPTSLPQENPKQKKPTSIPKAPRLAENTAPNKPQGAGRLFGTVGVGKVLHYLESVRLEVVEADRSLASLQSENRILKDKNKELEARNAKLERQLAEERTKNRKLSQQLSIDQNPTKPCVNNQMNKTNVVGAEYAACTNFNRSSIVNKETNDIDQRNQLSNSVEPTAPASESLLQASTEGTSTNQSRHVGQEHNQSLDLSPEGNESRVFCPTDPSSNFMAPQKTEFSLAPPLSSDVTGKDANSLNSEIACSAVGASKVSGAPPFAVLNGFDPLSSAADGADLVPVLAPSHQVSEKDSKRFDPLGTPKRSGSKLLLDATSLTSYSELNVMQQVATYPTQSHMDVSNSAIPTTLYVQPVHAAAAAPVIQPPAQNPPPTDPFDEIALRHGGSQKVETENTLLTGK